MRGKRSLCRGQEDPDPSPGVREEVQGSQNMYVCTVLEQLVKEQQNAGRELRYRSTELLCFMVWRTKATGPSSSAARENHKAEVVYVDIDGGNPCMGNGSAL